MLAFAALMAPIAAGAVIIDTTLGTRVQLNSPDQLRGRVIAVLGMVGAASGAIGGPLLGLLCDTVGPRLTLEIAGVLTVLATLVAAVVLARLSGVGPREAAAVALPWAGLRRVPAEQAS
jgi:MFS family permease